LLATNAGGIDASVQRKGPAWAPSRSERAAATPALVLTLPPGAYNAVVSGVGTATGTALVEIYELP